ncbi:MAG: response regulator transcription factor [Actinomycetota bacterium]|nr:response regulator transcription factor [Actinomycetota bacterium]
MAKKILLIEDDKKISNLVKELLEEENYVVDQEFDGEAGFFKALEEPYNLILLDIMLPKMNGFKVCSKIRSVGNQTPILMLTAKSGEYDLEEGLDTGADDYLTKPFSSVELKARVRALLRRNKNKGNTLIDEDLKIDIEARSVTFKDTEINLSEKEFDLLANLIENTGSVISKQELLEEVWDNIYPKEEELNNVEVYIGYLRKKLKPFKVDEKIKTVRGFGYRWS